MKTIVEHDEKGWEVITLINDETNLLAEIHERTDGWRVRFVDRSNWQFLETPRIYNQWDDAVEQAREFITNDIGARMLFATMGGPVNG
jgi:hypothetical protein